ncbi:MAG: EamA family transporter [Pseudomonadota bacterium]
MDLVWIPIAVAAGFFQAVRTAAQKAVNAHLSTWMTTYVRSLWGLPFLIAYLAIVVSVEGAGVPTVPAVYWLHVAGCALTQVLATWVLIRLFQRSNFAVGTILTKTDVMQAALIGSLLFSEIISFNGVFAIILSVLGVLLVSGRQAQGAFQRLSLWQAVTSVSTGLGLLTGFLFCLSYLFLREASLVMPEGSGAYRAAWTVVGVTVMQVVGLGMYMAWRERDQFAPMLRHWRPCVFIGLTSAAGSIGWFTAMAMQNASYVKAVGQTEVIFTILISTFFFRETISPREYVGIATIVASVVILAF